MPDDDIWNLIQGGNPGGPTVTAFANGVGQGGPGAGLAWSAYNAPPLSGLNLHPAALSSLMDAGVGSDVIADMLPQMNDGSPAATFPGTSAPPSAPSAAFLSPSALAPSQPLADPTPFALPDMTMDQAAMAWGMSPQQVAQIHRDALKQAATNIVTDAVVGGAVDLGLAAVGVPHLVVKLVGAGMDVHDALDIAQQLRDAPGQAIFKRLNDAEIQRIPSTAKTWLP